MATKTRGIRITEKLEGEILREAEAQGKSWSATTSELLEEALRMRRAPGVVFMDGPSGRRAVVAGTGIDVWEVIGAWKAGRMDDEKLRPDFDGSRSRNSAPRWVTTCWSRWKSTLDWSERMRGHRSASAKSCPSLHR